MAARRGLLYLLSRFRAYSYDANSENAFSRESRFGIVVKLFNMIDLAFGFSLDLKMYKFIILKNLTTVVKLFFC